VSKLWGGRFAGGPDPRFDSFQRSLRFDHKLWRVDVRGSIAWAGALARAGVLTADEHARVVQALQSLEAELERHPSELARAEDEDVHSLVERRLFELVGSLAKKLHTGRSRNDQVATDLKLWLREALVELDLELTELQRALVELADAHADLPMPGYTHMQRAQPITVGHHALAYVEMLARDRSRLESLGVRASTSPLGSGALAGTAYPIDREQLAHELGFARATRNSLDAVSDRDHAVELACACSLILTHLSRLSEDWIFFASQEAGFLQLADAVATGSSLMPQKKNPDGLELLRGKTGRVFGHLIGLLTLLKGLPLAYNKDLQEDKEALFACVETTREALAVAAIIVRNARFDATRCRAQASRGQLNATDLADLLVQRGLTFRDAHERAGAAVRAALELGIEVEELDPSARAELLPELAQLSPDELRELLGVDAVLARRDVLGGTAPARVRAEIAAWKKEL
jgi:argininosuccinate lyase